MVVSVIGMHRSGTSMVAKLLYLCGVYLGSQSELVPATPDNPDGHWEHIGFQEVNDEILSLLDGGWDYPPPMLPDWFRDSRFDHAREKASGLIAQFEGHEPWGWKDPRSSLTLPFWNQLLSNLKILICVRNPLEVAVSLRRRGLCSYALGLNLWKTYNQRILESTHPGHRIVTHYGSYFTDQKGELKRVLGLLGVEVSEEILKGCITTTRADLRHNRSSWKHLKEVGAPAEIIEIYQELCNEAGYLDNDPRSDGEDPVQALDTRGTLRFDINAIEAELLRRDVKLLRQTVTERNTAIAGLQARLGEGEETSREMRQQINSLQAEREELRRERDTLGQICQTQGQHVEQIQKVWQELREELARRDEELQVSLSDLRVTQVPPQDGPALSPQRVAYRQLVQRIRHLVRANVPRDATVLVASKGDEELLRFPKRRGWHYPQDEHGRYAGYYPANGMVAVAHLEVLRARGAEYLVLPSTAAWWLESYPDFKTHLESQYRVIAHQEDTGILFCLCRSTGKGPQSPREAFAQLVSKFQATHGRAPAVLDWGTGQELSAQFSELPVFVPPSLNGHLPYVDQSVDVVAIASEASDVLAEARRVAATAVINFSNGEGETPRASVTWIREPELELLPTTSIIVPAFNGWKHTAACLAALRETLPEAFRGEILVVDDASSDETAERLAQLRDQDARIRVLRNETNKGFIETCHVGVAEATGEFLIFLNNDTIPLPGWFPPLLRTFERFLAAGVVGGKLLFPDGRLQEAGGVIFRDASAAHFGRGEVNPSEPLFNYVREVDYCSGALLATRRSLFNELGGFGLDFRPGYYEDVDYCFRVRERGYHVYYQPESAVVHVEGATSGTDFSQGMKQYQVINQGRFAERWRGILNQQGDRPDHLGADTWPSLAW